MPALRTSRHTAPATTAASSTPSGTSNGVKGNKQAGHTSAFTRPVLFLSGLGCWTSVKPLKLVLVAFLDPHGVEVVHVKLRGRTRTRSSFAFLTLRTLADLEVAKQVLNGVQLREGGDSVYASWAHESMAVEPEATAGVRSYVPPAQTPTCAGENDVVMQGDAVLNDDISMNMDCTTVPGDDDDLNLAALFDRVW